MIKDRLTPRLQTILTRMRLSSRQRIELRLRSGLYHTGEAHISPVYGRISMLAGRNPACFCTISTILGESRFAHDFRGRRWEFQQVVISPVKMCHRDPDKYVPGQNLTGRMLSGQF